MSDLVPKSTLLFVEGEMKNAQHSVYRQRNENRQLRRQLERWKAERPRRLDRIKEIEGLKSALARCKYNAENAEQERDDAIEDCEEFEAASEALAEGLRQFV